MKIKQPEFIREFKEFAFKGNLIDMAVGIIIGGAFGTVVKSLVDDIFMPLIGVITGGIDFSDRFVVLRLPEGVEEATYNTIQQAKDAGAAVLPWGSFLTSLISFMIVAFVVFLVIKKFVGALMNFKAEDEPAKAPEPSGEEKLLAEIRDLLRDRQKA